MKRNLFLTFCALVVGATMQAQPHSAVAYDKSSNLLTTIRYGYGNTVESIIYTGKDQTTISVNSTGMPVEVTNSLATVNFTYAGARSVNVTQTVNGQTKTDKLSLDSDKVLNYREEYKKFNQNPSVIDKIDVFLAGGGAKMIGGVLSAITDKLDNPIGACFEEALEAAKQTDHPIIPINTLEALNEAANFSVNIPDHVTGALTDAIFNKYGEWTQAWSEMVYNYQKQKYQEQKASNRMEDEWRVSLAATLMANGKTFEEAAEAIAKANQKRVSQPGKSTPAPQKAKADNANKNDSSKNEGGKEPENEERDEDEELPDFEKPEGIISYAKMLSNEKHRGLPSMINVFYNRYALWDPLSYNLTLNPDKKTYDMEDYSKHAQGATLLGPVLDKPFVRLIIWWGADHEEVKIPVPKPVDNRESQY